LKLRASRLLKVEDRQSMETVSLYLGVCLIKIAHFEE